MVDIEDHRGDTIMKSLYLISLISPLCVALNLVLLLIRLGDVSVIKIPSLTFGKR